jgi:ketosteroid isomerase-like protein
MKKFLKYSVLTIACFLFLEMPKARTEANNEAEVRQLLDRWAKAFHAKDLNGIMSIYEPGQALVSYDIVPPLQYTGFEAYKKDYREFLDQFQGPIDIEYRDLSIIASDTVAFSRGLERMTGTLKNGQKFNAWVRFTEGYRKTSGHWLAIHDHISVPVDLDTGKAALDLKP